MSAGLSPLLPPDDPPRVRRARILRGIARETALLAGLTLTAPIVIPVAALVDLTLWIAKRKPAMALRLFAIVWWSLFGELRGVLGVAAVWLRTGGPWTRDSEQRRRHIYRLQVRWATGHLDGLCRICRVGFAIEGEELIGEGPMIVFMRHASIIDNGLPASLVSRAHGIDLRYALKAELQQMPTLDLGAFWVPTSFVKRGSDDSQREIDRVRTLATGLDGPRDGVLIYPEGTRFTARKLNALKERDDLRPQLRARVAALRHMLPPRLGGPLAVMDEAPHAAVVICGHVGLDGFSDLRAIWRGDLVGATVHVRFWRYESDELPDDRETWLYDRWQELDDWVAENKAAGVPQVAGIPVG